MLDAVCRSSSFSRRMASWPHPVRSTCCGARAGTRGVGPPPPLPGDWLVPEPPPVADTAGRASLSMQHLAERLGCAKMALYRYVPGKAELVALMIDVAIGEPPSTLESA